MGKATIASLSGAQIGLREAQVAKLKVEAAEQALTAAYDEARVTAATKGLSKGTKTAADAAVSALDEARKRLTPLTIKEFEEKVAELNRPLKIYNLTVSSGEQVAKAALATWDRRVLKAPGLTWSKGKAEDYRGKKLLVSGKPENAHDQEGISNLFRNDMKLKSGTTNEFEAY